MMGVNALKQQAQRFIASTRENAPLVKMQTELAQRDNSIAALEDQIKKLAERLEAKIAK